MTSDIPTTHHQGELRVERGVWGLNERHAERFVDCRCLSTARDNADLFTINGTHKIALSSDTGIIEMKADELLRKSRFLLLEERSFSDEIALIELHDPTETTLKRGDILSELMAVEGKRRFKTK